MTKLNRTDRAILERNRHKLRPDDGFATVVLDDDDVTMIAKHCPDLAEMGYRAGDETAARIISSLYRGILDEDDRAQNAAAEAERDKSNRRRASSGQSSGPRARNLRKSSEPKETRTEIFSATVTDSTTASRPAGTKFASRLTPLIDAVAEAIGKLSARIEALERRPILRDAGVFNQSQTYSRGDGVTFGGSFWICQEDGVTSKPGVGKLWRLAVKRGRDGKDAGQ